VRGKKAELTRLFYGKKPARRKMKNWEIIADNLSKAGWSWRCVSTINSNGQTILADAHRDDGKRFVVHSDEKLSAFVELERQAREDWLKNVLLKKDQSRQWVLWVSKGKSELKNSHIARYLSYGEHQTFGEGKVSLVAAYGKARHIAMNFLACRSGVQFRFP
jgi:hypothetical protein